MNNNIRIGISHGDINGIGYEVIMKALSDTSLLKGKTIIIYGAPKVAAFYRKMLNLSNINFNQVKSVEEALSKKINIINCVDNNIRVDAGQSTEMAGQASFDALKASVEDLKNNKIDALVTAPINKKNIISDNFQFPGHTEYLAKEFGVDDVVMLLVSDTMKIGVVTGHIPVKEVAKTITKELIIKKLQVLHKSLIEDFNIIKPHIAVLGLNPHSGDEGVIGDEEQKIIIPAIDEAKQKHGIYAFGPYSADGFFGSGNFAKFDAILAMYHDQGLIPFKAMSFEEGVNVTLGLPSIRTSPGHGTAYEIAGQNKASELSFKNALYVAIDIFEKRTQYKELIQNQLKPQKID
jgi:4-hydroxythreonine-4-phosphate dehydrogenase